MPETAPKRTLLETSSGTLAWLAVAWLAAGWLAATLFSAAAWGAEPAAAPQAAPLRYRRVYAAADAMAQWPRAAGRYVPVETDRFERLLRTAQQRDAAPPGVARPACVAAEYSARLEGDALVSGVAVLDIRNASGRSMPLPLEPMGLAAAAPQWEGEPPRPAPWGVGDDGRLAVQVDASGRLRWTWSLGGTRDADGALALSWAVPPASSHRLSLELPADLTLSADAGVVSAAEASGATRRWRIELGGASRCLLRIAADSPSRATRSAARVRSAMTCEVSTSGLNLVGTLTVDSPQSSTRELALDADASLELVSVRQGDAALSWRVQPSAGAPGRKRHVVALAEPIRGQGRSLRFHAVAPFSVGGLRRVPLVHVEPALWQESTFTLVVAAPLRWDDLRVTRGRQVGGALLPESRRGATAEFQLFGPDAAVEVSAALDKSPLALDAATTLQMRGLELVAQASANVRSATDPYFHIEAEVSRRWAIDAVESTPPDAVADWTVRPASAPPVAGGGKGAVGTKAEGGGSPEPGARLAIRLARSIGPERAIRIRVAARYALPPVGRPLSADDWNPVRFVAPPGGRRMIALDAADDYQVSLTGDERLARIDAATLPAGLSELFPAAPRGLVFEADRAAAALQVLFQTQKPQYTATLRVEAAAVERDTLRESLSVRCEPQSGRIDRVLIDVKPVPAAPLRWSLENEDDQQLSARAIPRTDAAGTGVQTWEITLRRPRSAAFALRAALVRPFSQRTPVTLLAAPEAASQQGTLAVLATETPPQIDTSRLAPEAAESPGADRSGLVRAAFRYDPAKELANATWPMQLVPAAGEPLLPSAWVWSAHYESHFEPGGAVHHAIALRLQSGGRQRLRVRLPSGYGEESVVGVWIDQARGAWSIAPPDEAASDDDAARTTLDLELPGGREFSSIVVQLIRRDAPLGLCVTLRPPQIEADVPVLAHRWTAWAPSTYEGAARATAPVPEQPAGDDRLRRVFGALARNAQQPRFDPFAADAWRGSSVGAAARSAQRRQVQQWFDAIGRAAAPPGGAGGPRSERTAPATTWADFFAVAAERWSGTLRIDRAALATAELSARATIAAGLSSGPSPPGAGAVTALLEQSELAILLLGDVAIVTTAAEVGLIQGGLESVAGDVVWRVAPGPLAGRLADALADRSNPRYLAVDAWKKLPPESRTPWNVVDVSSRAAPANVGWTAFQTAAWENAAPAVSLYRRDAALGLALAAGLAGCAAVLWGAARFPRRIALAAGICAAATLLVDGLPALLARGLLLGAFFGAICLIVALRLRKPRPGAPAAAPVKSVPSSVVRTAAPLLLAALGGATALEWLDSAAPWAVLPQAHAQPPEADAGPAPKSPRAPEVIVPVDDQLRPVGNRCYVPEEFLRRLQQAASGDPVLPGRWRIRSAVYRASVEWPASGDALAISPLHAVFDVETFVGRARLRLPAGAGGLRVAEGSVAVDGKATPPVAAEAGEALEVPIDEPGRYRVEMDLRPAADARGEQQVFDWTLPRAAAARLELSLPADMPTPRLAGAFGAATRELQPSRVVAELGPTDRLALAWRSADVRSHRALVDAEEHLWLKVKPGAVTLHVLLKCRAAEGRVGFVQVETDPRLQPAGDSAAPSSPQPVAAEGELRGWRIALAQPAEGAFAVPMQFHWKENSGVGVLRAPAFRLVGARTTKRWLAVSADPELRVEAVDDEPSARVAPSAFAASWGGDIAPPALAVALSALKNEFRVAVVPAAARTTVEQTTTYSLSDGAADVALEASLSTSGGAVFQHRLLAGPEIDVSRVTLSTQDVERAVRWSRAADGALVVFSDMPLSEKQQLRAWGRAAVPRRGQFALPPLRVAGDDARTASFVRVLRQASVRAQVVGAPETPPADMPAGESPRLPGRAIASFRLVAGRSALPVRVEPNRPRVRAEQALILRSNESGWDAELLAQLHVADGLVDQVRVELPAAVVAPLRTEPAGTLDVAEPDAAGTRVATFRPAAPIAGDYTLRIIGALRSAEGEPTAAPSVRLVGVDVARRLVVLPVQRQVQPLWWETRGLLATELPETLGIPPAARQAWAAYVVLREPWQATLRPDGRAGAGPRVPLADIHVWREADGVCTGVARFDIEPLGSPECRLEIPPECRVFAIVVDGHRVTPDAVGPTHWSIPLGAAGLPQRLDVLFSLPLNSRGASAALAPPWPTDLPVRQACWTLHGLRPTDESIETALEEARPAQQELLQLRSTTELMESVGRESSPDRGALSAWHRQWTRYWNASRDALLRCAAESDDRPGEGSLAEVASLERRIAALAGLAGQTGQPGPIGKPDVALPTPEPAPADDLLALWSALPGNNRSAEHWIGQGEVKRLEVTPTVARASTWSSAAAAFVLLTAWIAVVWAVGKSQLPAWLVRWPAAAILAVGVFWWAWLEPSALGMLIGAIAVAWLAWSWLAAKRQARRLRWIAMAKT